MIHRLLSPSSARSFFVFGARGTGKSTFIKHQWDQSHYYVNLLLDRWETRYSRSPDSLISDIEALKPKPKWVVIDEIQKVPKLLDIVHEMIESKKIKFALTGSSARKLKRGAANLLAGRAFQYELFPLTHRELKDKFNLESVLNWGSLPNVFELSSADRIEYLNSYTRTYLKEEILQEQIVRKSIIFSRFLEIAAQENGKSLNFAKIARDIGSDIKTVQSYFQVLEDTLIGMLIPAYNRSARKSVKHRPKFYIFDLGIKKAMEGSLDAPLTKRTSAYGMAFEHFCINEMIRLNSYSRSGYTFSHYQTTAGGEIDLILTKGKTIYSIEIKSSEAIDRVEVNKLERVAEALSPTRIFYLSQDKTSSKIGKVECMHWQSFMKQIF